MKKYKVLKSFPSSDGAYLHKEGDIYKPTQSASRTKSLERLGFIKENSGPENIWDLGYGNIYWIINPIYPEDIAMREWQGSMFERHHRDIGDVFLSREEAVKELAYRKAKQILIRDAKDYKPNWNTYEPKYYIFYDCVEMKLIVVFTEYRAEGNIYFATRKEAKESIAKHEKEWKIYLGVEE